MIRFEHIEFLYALGLIPLLILIYIYYRSYRRRALGRIGDRALVRGLIPDASRMLPNLKFLLILLAFASLMIALANPEIGTKLVEVKRKGVEVILAVDVSNSMLAEDIKPNRLDRAKQATQKLINKLVNDRIGLIAFAGKAFLQLPLTTDYSAARLMVSTLNTDLVSSQGTAIGAAIDMACETFSKDVTRSKVLIIITDGENFEDDALDAAKKAVAQGIKIYTIGMGSEQGAPIPVYQGNQIVNYRKDRDGQTVITKMNPDMLSEIANTGNGKFIPSDNYDPDLAGILDEISGMEKSDFGTKMFSDYEDRFQIFLGIALALVVVEYMLGNRSNRIMKRFRDFLGEKK